MGCWGMGMTQSDEFCEVYDQFMERYDEGKLVPEITAEILAEYHKEFSDQDSVLHDVYFALAKAEWMCCAQSEAVLRRIGEIIDSGSNLTFYRELGAREADLKVRKKNLDKFRTSLQTPRGTPRKRKPQPKYLSAEARKGLVFWYKSKGAVYGAVVLEVLSKNSILVALSEALEGEPKTVDTVLDAAVYTATWFGTLLPPRRVHEIGAVDISENYNGRAGMYQTENVHFCENFGLDYQWEHERCVLSLPGRKLRDLLKAENVPSNFVHQERLDALLAGGRAVNWISG